MLLKAAAIAAIAGVLLVALPSDQRRPYRTSEFRVPSRYRHEPREMDRIDRIAKVGKQWYAYFGRDSIALTLR